MSEDKPKRPGTEKGPPWLATRAPPPPRYRLSGGCTPPQAGKETSNPPPEYSPSLSQVVEFNAARRECRSIIEKGGDLTGVDQLEWEYEAKRWVNIARPRLDQAVTDRRKSGAPEEHLAMLARELSIIDNEWKHVCEYRTVASQPNASIGGRPNMVHALAEWLEKEFAGEPASKSMKDLARDAKALFGKQPSNRTMQRAVKAYDGRHGR